jgi:hypothetical protein
MYFQVRIWLLSLGFTTLFGALFTKTYRVYVVFRDQKMKVLPQSKIVFLILSIAKFINYYFIFIPPRIFKKKYNNDKIYNKHIFAVSIKYSHLFYY